MRYIALAFVALLLTLNGCATSKEKAPEAAPGEAKMADDAQKEATFTCAHPGCPKTKTGTLANPPS